VRSSSVDVSCVAVGGKFICIKRKVYDCCILLEIDIKFSFLVLYLFLVDMHYKKFGIFFFRYIKDMAKLRV
jgi:hypothetical protein